MRFSQTLRSADSRGTGYRKSKKQLLPGENSRSAGLIFFSSGAVASRSFNTKICSSLPISECALEKKIVAQVPQSNAKQTAKRVGVEIFPAADAALATNPNYLREIFKNEEIQKSRVANHGLVCSQFSTVFAAGQQGGSYRCVVRTFLLRLVGLPCSSADERRQILSRVLLPVGQLDFLRDASVADPRLYGLAIELYRCVEEGSLKRLNEAFMDAKFDYFTIWLAKQVLLLSVAEAFCFLFSLYSV